jgi:hypothetical protein|nr:MAG TPA: hypothetical protein [Bacteriophage sp.]
MSKALDMARELVKKLEEEEKQSKVQLSALNPGDVFKIGEHDFIVLMQCREETAVISKGFMAENVKFDEDSRNYKESNLKKVIENLIQPVIEVEVGSKNLIEHEVDLTSVDMQDEFGGFKCKVRPITFDEARLYNNLLVNKNLNGWWWTCTPWSTEDRGWKYSIAVVAPAGFFSNGYCGRSGGVRPFCILKSNIFVSKGE